MSPNTPGVDPNLSAVMEIPWEVREREILADVNRKATILMWLGYSVYTAGSAAIFLTFGDKPISALLIMMLFQFMVIWMGTKAMYANMSAMFQLSLATNREMMPTFERLAAAAERIEAGEHPTVKRLEATLIEASSHLSVIKDALERATKPIAAARRPEATTSLPRSETGSRPTGGGDQEGLGQIQKADAVSALAERGSHSATG